ncbi:MAG TPA: ElyC/SanA/YdcF family protein, partial [Polyangia bacterium]
MWQTIFVLAGPGRPGEPLPRATQLRLDAARALCDRHPAIERVIFVGGAATTRDGLSLSEHMKRRFEADRGRQARSLELVVRSRSNTTAGNVREMGEAVAELGLPRTLPVVSRRAHFVRIVRHARRLGFAVEPLTIEAVLGPEALP